MKTAADIREPIPCKILEDDAAMSASNRDPSFRDFLRFVAMRRSLSRAEEYEKLSDGAIPEEQKSFFSDMAELKQYEIECLRRYRSNGRIVSLETKNQPPLAARPDGPAQKSFSNLEDACRFGMNKELEDYCLYLRLADLEEELATKRLFLYLVRLLKSSLDYVQNRLELIASLHELKGNADAADVCNNYSSAQIA
jgi:hypothetical protein